MKHFVLVFDRRHGRLLREDEFLDARAAMRERFAAERLHRGNPDIEVVVLGAESAVALRTTHARYFQDAAALSRRGLAVIRAAHKAAAVHT